MIATGTKLLAIGLCALSLAGCALFESKADRALRNSPNYRAGYSDGCTTASSQSANMRADTTVRDDNLFRTDKAYRAGWSGGFSSCRMGPMGGDAASGAGPIHDPAPGGGGIGY